MEQIPVTYRILLFGAAREIASSSEISMELPSPCLVRDIRVHLNMQFPKMKEMKSYAIAVNRTFAHDEVACSPACEIAIIPPVSGG
jgi:molybdopterin synthase sulfur carrier subunit